MFIIERKNVNVVAFSLERVSKCENARFFARDRKGQTRNLDHLPAHFLTISDRFPDPCPTIFQSFSDHFPKTTKNERESSIKLRAFSHNFRSLSGSISDHFQSFSDFLPVIFRPFSNHVAIIARQLPNHAPIIP
jgi:hypothetical protein